jgi:lipoprotein-anchoring transpeptidase ErfK/SrfK
MSFGSIFSGNWDEDDDQPRGPFGPKIADGGARPSISPQSPTVVTYNSGQAPGTIVIDTAARRLYLVQANSKALSYPISVGREGFSWTGTEKITRMASWPDWHPPAEMRERDPRLPEKMTGGVRNPLGAKALYLGNTLYRIHGTSDARSIGRAASSGCFRMHNRHVVDLARRVGVGTKVVVVAGSRSTRTAHR